MIDKLSVRVGESALSSECLYKSTAKSQCPIKRLSTLKANSSGSLSCSVIMVAVSWSDPKSQFEGQLQCILCGAVMVANIALLGPFHTSN